MSNALGLEKLEGPVGGSNKSFGLMFGAIFFLVTVFLFFRGKSNNAQILTFGVSLVWFAVAFFAPQLLAIPNRLWMRLSLLLAKFISPVVLAILFFILISPLAIVLRLFGRDTLLLKHQLLTSHWRRRVKSFYTLEWFKNQY